MSTYFLILVIFSTFCDSKPNTVYNYVITKTWNGYDVTVGEEIYITFSIEEICGGPLEKRLQININAPFYNDPPIPSNNSTSVLEPTWGLWDYEVVELYFYGKDEEYMEIQLGPHGHHLVLYLKGYRNIIKKHLPLEYPLQTQIMSASGPGLSQGRRWLAEARIPGKYFPCSIFLHNAFAIHKSGLERTYLALYPTFPGEIKEPDFHYNILKIFQNFSFHQELNEECDKIIETSTGLKKKVPKFCLYFLTVLIAIKNIVCEF
jgi:hypothetical protein